MNQGDLVLRVRADDPHFYIFVEPHHETDSWGWFIGDRGLELHSVQDFIAV